MPLGNFGTKTPNLTFYIKNGIIIIRKNIKKDRFDTMELNTKQEEGLKIAVARFKERQPWTCIAGYAGTGKSTLIKFIIAALGVNEEDVAYVAYTGKAANVLKQKGCLNAITAHKLLYHAVQMPDGKYMFKSKRKLDGEYKIIVVDEVSMLPKVMWELLLTHRVHILATGDPGQLPPINKDQDNQVLAHPHIFLDEIMRQEAESEIIRLSMHVREGRPIGEFKASGAQVQIIDKSQLITGMYEWADQILCATNKTRQDINNLIRQLRGYGVEPEEDDKIISLHNHWGILSLENSPLTNGSIGSILRSEKQYIYYPQYINNGEKVEVLWTHILDESGEHFMDIPIDYKLLTTGEKALTSMQEYKITKNKKLLPPPYEFAYGYAITTHKAQGSEWNKVLLIEESFPFDKEEHKRWLYTGITRASDKLVVVKGD